MSEELTSYLNSFAPSIRQRAYDGKWLIWKPLVSANDSGEWSLDWEIRGVFNSYNAASKEFRKLTA